MPQDLLVGRWRRDDSDSKSGISTNKNISKFQKGWSRIRDMANAACLTQLAGLVCVWLVTQSCPTLCDPMDCSPPGSSVHGNLQARLWSGLPCPPPGDLSNPEIEPRSPTLRVDSLPAELPGKPWFNLASYMTDESGNRDPERVSELPMNAPVEHRQEPKSLASQLVF